MYKVNPNDAMTEMYDIGKADAQVFDNRQLQDRLYKKADQGLADKKAKDAEQKGLMTSIGKLGKGAIRPSDLGYFSDGQKAIYDKVKKYYAEAKGGDLSIDQQVEIESDIVDLQTKAGVSAQLSAENTANANKYNANPGKYRKSSLDATIDNQFNPKNGGNFGSRGGLEEYIDLDEFVNSKLAPEAMKQAQMVNDGENYSNTPEDRARLVDGVFANQDYAHQAELNYAEIPESERRGTTNAKDFYAKEWDERLTVYHKPRPFAPQGNGGSGNEPKYPNVAGTFMKTGEGKGKFQFEYTNTPDNPYIMIKDPKNPKKELNIKPLSVNVDKVNPENTTMEATVQLSEKQKVENDEASEGEAKPNPETVTLDYIGARDILNNKFGIKNVFSIQGGRDIPSHVKVEYSDATGGETKKVSPSEGDKKTFTQGPATFKGGKWVLDKK